jgi:lipopolysaccharide export LptBFGC system permease protein LptF
MKNILTLLLILLSATVVFAKGNTQNATTKDRPGQQSEKPIRTVDRPVRADVQPYTSSELTTNSAASVTANEPHLAGAKTEKMTRKQLKTNIRQNAPRGGGAKLLGILLLILVFPLALILLIVGSIALMLTNPLGGILLLVLGLIALIILFFVVLIVIIASGSRKKAAN